MYTASRTGSEHSGQGEPSPDRQVSPLLREEEHPFTGYDKFARQTARNALGKKNTPLRARRTLHASGSENIEERPLSPGPGVCGSWTVDSKRTRLYPLI